MQFMPERFISAMENNNLSNEDLLKILQSKHNISLTIDTLKSYRRKGGKNATPSIEKLSAIASILGVSTDYLVGLDNMKPVRKIPVKGTASCGMPDSNHMQAESRPVYYHGQHWNKDLYAVVASGDSMAPDIEDGDEVICDPSIEPQNGDMVHYIIHDESAIKIFVKDDEAHILQFVPYNQTEKFKTRSIRLDDEETMAYLKIAKVVAVNKLKFNNRLARLRMIGRA